MAVSFQLPPGLEQHLRDDIGDLDAEAKESLLVALYRRGKLSHRALCEAMGLDRLETEDVLQKHGVVEDLGSVDDYLRDAKTLEELRGTGRG